MEIKNTDENGNSLIKTINENIHADLRYNIDNSFALSIAYKDKQPSHMKITTATETRSSSICDKQARALKLNIIRYKTHINKSN